MRKINVALCFVILMVCAGCSQQAQNQPASPKGEAYWLDGLWPHEKSALPVHDKAVFGTLENGLRYVIQPNKKPENRVSVQLDVQAGSLMERDNELGLAHFLEHMAFNGSKNFPPGTLIPFFQKNGMAFGRDANAYTSFHETVYTLSLASNEQENLNKGLRIMRDVADGLSILPEEVEKERGVVLSEKAARDSENYRAGTRLREKQFAGTRMTNAPIGLEEIIKNASAETIRGFYDAWYRPELMVVVIVGDVVPAEVEQEIKAIFGDLKAHGEPRELESWGDTDHKGVVTYHDKYDTETTMVSISSMQPRRWQNDSEAVQRRMVYESLANSIVAKRFQRMRATGDAPFFGAFTRAVEMFKLYPSAAFIAKCEADKWEDTFMVLQDELNRVLKYGFLESELDEVRAEMLRAYKLRMQRESSLTNEDIAQTIIGCVNGNRVYQSWAQTYEMYERFINDATTKALHDTFASTWSADNRLLHVTGNAVIEGDANARIKQLWEAGEVRIVAEPVDPKPLNYPYVAEPKTAGERKRVKVTTIPGTELKLHEVTFKNGFVLRMLPTEFDLGQISMSVLIGGGLEAIDDANYLTAVLAGKADAQSGIGNLTAAEQQRLFRRGGFMVNGGISSDFYSISGSGRTDEVTAVMQAMWTQFKDPAFTAKDRKLMLEGLAVADAGRFKDVPGTMSIKGRHFLFGKDLRNSPITAEQAKTVSLEDMQTALKDILAGGDGVMNVIGDFEPQAIEKLVGKFFGSAEVAWKPAASRVHAYVPVFPPASDRERSFSVESTLDQAALRMAFERKLEDTSDRKGLMTRRMLTSILRDRLRETIREELGASYSPSCMYWADDTTGFGIYMIRIGTQPDKLDVLKNAVDSVVAEMRATGVTKEELDRLRKPFMTAWNQSRTQNGSFMRTLQITAREDKPYFLWSSKFPEYLEAITVDDLNKEASVAFDTARKATITGTEKSATN